ncbi:complement factor D-like protein [Labeo rohita]|uniref:trypsin n=1 Tax=Labeo rohita TaxID=84645 RepID=A0A498MWJ4_LABRO|nr:complement factor D-like protein [Labeo rohita]
MTIISLLLLASLLPHLTFTAHVDVGIVNGTEAKPHSRPYMVSLQKNNKHICGGFLISDDFVLTAAHCQKGDETLTAVVGAHNLKNENEGSVRIRVKSYHKHPDYSTKTHWNDIMLLRLEKKEENNKNIKKISIPKQERDIKADSVCSVAGWGSLSLNGLASDRLMETKVYIMDNTECEKKWRKNYSVSKMMCTYGFGGSCDGDSGGPLVCGDTAVGVSSFGDSKTCNKTVIKHCKAQFAQLGQPEQVSKSFPHQDTLEKEAKQNEILTQEGDIKPDPVCSVVGWGRLSYNGEKSKRLMEADVKIMNNTDCTNKWEDKNTQPHR